MSSERKIQLTNALLLGGALSSIIVYSLTRDPEKIEPQQESAATSTLLSEATTLPVKVSMENN